MPIKPIGKPRVFFFTKKEPTGIDRATEQWSSVLFNDASTCDGRLRVWTRAVELHRKGLVQEVVNFGVGLNMLWISISYNTYLPLVYTEDIIADHLVSGEPLICPRFLFQNDNAIPHVAGKTRQFLGELPISVMDWPALSPDLSPVERL